MTRKPVESGQELIEELLRDADRLALSAHQKARLRYALALRGRNSTRKDRQRADRVVAEVQRELLAGMDETVKMERARGGVVEDFNDAGAKWLSSRDGVLSLYRADRLSAEQVGVALAYRRAREQQGAVRSQLAGVDGASRGEADLVGIGLVRAKLSVAASRVDIDVAMKLRHRPDALEVLRRVAGDGMCLGALASGGRQFERLLEGLVMALVIAARRVSPDAS